MGHGLGDFAFEAPCFMPQGLRKAAIPGVLLRNLKEVSRTLFGNTMVPSME